MKKAKTIGLFAALFFVFFVLIFIFLAAILICINNFLELSDVIWFWRVVGISAIVAFAGTLIVRSKKHIGETTFSFWVHKNCSKIIVGYFLFLFALISVRNESIWTTVEVYDILSIQWTIFGLSLTIFLVWNVIIVEFLKGRQPQKHASDDLLQKHKIVLEKRAFSQEVEITYSTILLLTINLFLLLISTSLIYIIAKPNSVLTQNVLHCSFFFTSNSIACLFLDILKPLKKEKTEMLKNNNVTKSEIDNAYTALFIQDVIKGIIEELNLDSEKYTPEVNEKLHIRCLEIFQDAMSSNAASKSEQSKTDPLNRGDTNGKIKKI